MLVPSAHRLKPVIRSGSSGNGIQRSQRKPNAHVETDAVHVVERDLAVEERDRVLEVRDPHRADVEIAALVLAVAFRVVAHAQQRAEFLREELAAAPLGDRLSESIASGSNAGSSPISCAVAEEQLPQPRKQLRARSMRVSIFAKCRTIRVAWPGSDNRDSLASRQLLRSHRSAQLVQPESHGDAQRARWADTHGISVNRFRGLRHSPRRVCLNGNRKSLSINEKW